uniref:ARAD1C21912p n=1 Tax=Blastobotrys adeninivorans TaxID=409370 RepID=A0A060T6P7_BLAAD
MSSSELSDSVSDESMDEYTPEPKVQPRKLVLKLNQAKGERPRRSINRALVSSESESGTSTPARGGRKTYDYESDEEEEPEEPEEMEEEQDYDEEMGEDELTSTPGTPDITRMTARQRAKFTTADSGLNEDLLELPPEPSKKKRELTEEEMQLKRAELARRRKNLSDKRLEEEKQETIDKLLKKRAHKGRSKEPGDDDGAAASNVHRSRLIQHPAFSSWTSSKDSMTYSYSLPQTS